MCTICKHKFTLHKNLKRHLSKTHNHKFTIKSRRTNKYAKHKCTLCTCKFVALSSLRRHEKLKHYTYFTPTVGIQK